MLYTETKNIKIITFDLIPDGRAISSSVAAACPIPNKSICRILKLSGLRTYRLSLHQAMIPADFQQRVNFAQWILSNGALLHNVLEK